MMLLKRVPVGVPQIGAWVIRRSPPSMRPYLRLIRIDLDAGWWLLTFPVWWGLALASDGALPDPILMMLLLAGCVLMEGAGCAFNDMADVRFDRQVRRTAVRPLPSKQVTMPQAVVYLIATLLLALCVLLTFNTFTIMLCITALPLLFIYPFMKRITYWPQAFLGIVFTWGALAGWAAERGALDLAPVLLYAGCFFWVLHFDTIYAHQDREDDIFAGVKSSALALGRRTRPALAVFDACLLGLVGAAGWTAGLGWAFWPLLSLVALHFAWQLWNLDIDDRDVCGRLFNSNWSLGWLMLAAIVAGQLTR